jgi:4-amino-4-deoxy-L-arabinose transferase-like glycosyltransferase
MLPRAARWRLLAIASGLLLLILYLYGLDRMGMYDPDEPRYASIGREMAHSGDFITPRLWGKPWFEKPALIYWIVAAGFRAGLSEDLAPRVPVAVFSVAFLIAFYWLLRREFSPTAAAYSTVILATSVGWLALSQAAVTDAPMAALFSIAVLCTLPWLRTGERRWLNYAAIALGGAVLAKSALPLVFALPALWFGRDRLRDLFRPVPVFLFLAVVLPWYAACYLINGSEFIHTLFWSQQVERLVSPALMHVQPFWFYLPILPAGLFPWFPALALLFRRDLYADRRLRYLLATVAWGFVFLSASTNKLPGYLLGLIPPLAVLVGVALERAKTAGRVVIALSALACAAFPLLIMKLPAWMTGDRSLSAPLPLLLSAFILFMAAFATISRNRGAALASVALLATCGYLWIKTVDLPLVDPYRARPIWRQIASRADQACADDLPRNIRYGLNYYSVTPLPDCHTAHDRPIRLVYRDHRAVVSSNPK